MTPEIEAAIEARTFASVEALLYAERCAKQDMADVLASDVLVLFTGVGSGGGRHTEFGFALGCGVPVMGVGPRENVFHSSPSIRWYPTWPLALRGLVAESRRTVSS